MTEIKPTATESWLAKIALPRMGLWLYVTIALAVLAYFFVPHMLQVAVYKLGLITAGGYLGYHISRALEKRGWRPHDLVAAAAAEQNSARKFELEQLASALYQRRTWLVSACMIAAALGS